MVRLRPDDEAYAQPDGRTLEELETASRFLDDALAWFAERGEPLNGHDDIQHQRKMDRRGSYGTEGTRRLFIEALSLVFEFQIVAADLVSKFWHRHFYSGSSLYIDRGMADVFPIYGDSGRDLEGFVLSSVDNLAGCRIYPADVPTDQIGLSFARFGSAANRIRFLSELAGIYSHAVGLTRQPVRFQGRLVALIRNLVGFLRIALSPYRYTQSTSTRSTTDDGENSSNIHSPYLTREEEEK